MNQLLFQELKNLVYYKQAKFEFKPGITCILGLNKNAKTAGASNGAGKSSLLIPLHAALGFQAPLIKGRQGVKDIFGRSSEASLTWKRGKSTYRSIRKGSKFTVFKDGKDLGLRTQALALEKLESLRGLTETQFYATVYLDSSKPHAFQAGTSTERLNFFTDLFNLHDVDGVRTYCRQLLNDAADAEKEMTRLKQELAALAVKDVTADKEKYDKLVRVQDKTQRLLRIFTAVKHQLDLWERHQKLQSRIDKLQSAVGDNTIKGVRKKLNAIAEASKSVAALESWTEKRDRLQSELDSLLPAKLKKLGFDELKQSLREFDKIDDLEKPIKPRSERDQSSIKKLRKMLGAEPQAKHIKILEKKEAQLSGRISELRSTSRELRNHLGEKHSDCPLCKSTLKANHFDRMLEALDNDKARADKQLATATKLRSALEAEIDWIAYEKFKAEFDKARADYDPDLHKKLERYVKLRLALDEHLTEKPQVVVLDFKADRKELQDLAEKLTELDTLKNQARLPEGTEDDLRSFARSNELPFEVSVIRTWITDKEPELTQRLRAVNDKIPSLRSAIDMAQADAKRAKKLSTEIEEKKAAATDAPVLKMLVEAYSKTGIKSLLIKRIAKMVEKNLNRLAPKILREPMKFELIVDGANFHVLCTRQNMGKPKTSDVRTLSGAERRMFILMSLLAKLPLMPASKRYDTIILDEPDANLDEPNREMLRTRLLPQLKKVVPKIVVLSPNLSIVPPGARIVTAVKDGDVTKLVHSKGVTNG